MTTRTHYKSAAWPSRREGASTLEALVALTLLSGVLAMATPLVVRHGWLLSSHREYQLALEELSNQLDRLSALPEDDLAQALEQLAPSEMAATHLPGAELRGELAPAEPGKRLILRLSWERSEGRTTPISLAGWVYPETQRSGLERSQEDAS